MSWPLERREDKVGRDIVRDTTVLEVGVIETEFLRLEGSQAVPANPAGKGFVQFWF
jgi:hypothetical protein